MGFVTDSVIDLFIFAVLNKFKSFENKGFGCLNLSLVDDPKYLNQDFRKSFD